MTIETFERFLNPGDRASAVIKLVETGDNAISMLLSLFDGSAKNGFGSPYKDIGASECGFEVALRLGPKAKPLEPYLRDGSRAGYVAAVAALGNLERLDPSSVDTLAEVVRSGHSVAQGEAVAALIKRGFGDHACLAELGARSDAWRQLIAHQRLNNASQSPP